MDNLPFVSAIIVTRNEQNYINIALESLLNQTYPKDKYEIIIVDGLSTDSTLKRVKEIVGRNHSVAVRIFSNDKKILSSGWNIGIKQAKGDYVIRIDAHAKAKEDFLENSVKTISSVDAVCVGGKLITKSLDGDNPLVAKVLSSPFGVGNSSFRVSNMPKYSDTAVYGLYIKRAIEEAGYFDERFVRNQDIELHSRIKKNGGKFYFNPEIESEYYSRSSVKKMLKQNFGNGKWNMILLRTNFKSLSLRHLIPLFFLLYLVISIPLGFLTFWIWVAASTVLFLYFALGLIFSIKKTKKPSEFLIMPFLFFLLHITYGTGYLCGIFHKIGKKRSLV